VSFVSSHGWLLGGNSELSGNLEGIFNKGKFYFEVSTFSENNHNFSTNSDNTWVYNCLNLAIAASNNERVASTGLRNNSTIYKTIGLNLPKYSSSNTGFLSSNQNLFNRTLTPKTKFTPGVQHGILLDFDNKQSWFLNPTWTSAAPGKYPFTTDPLAALTGNSFLLALMFGNYGVAVDFLDDIYLNFGQSTFAQGLGNIASSVFGTMGGCVLVGQTNLNISAGAKHRLSGLVAALGLSIIILVFGKYIEKLPLVGLIGVMLVVVYETGDWRSLTTKNYRNLGVVIATVASSLLSSNLAIGVIIGSTVFYISKLILRYDSNKK
jgi:hypothetical protein